MNNLEYLSGFKGPKNSTMYEDGCGNLYSWEGGTPAWRNNNPGNVIYNQFARENGAIGRSGNWAVFPDYQTGENAVKALLKSDKYQNLNIEEAFNRYAPSHENDTEGYISFIEKQTMMSRITPLSQMTDQHLGSIVDAIKKYEGYKKGKIRYVKPDEKYIWGTQGDDKVRGTHSILEGVLRNWGDHPRPGQEINCRCEASPAEPENMSKYNF